MTPVSNEDVCIAVRRGGFNSDNYKVVEQYLKEGGDPNLMTVAIYGPASLLHAVIQYDLPPDKVYITGYSADGVAMFSDTPQPRIPDPLAKLLVHYGASLQSVDAQGMTVEYVIRFSSYSDHYAFLLNVDHFYS